MKAGGESRTNRPTGLCEVRDQNRCHLPPRAG